VTGTYADERLVLVVGDDGRGGADASGSGLGGVARRLGAFDGTLVVDSPAGGPTTVRMEVPCRPE
jgi:signal transduction histidine kinase